jgi:uncharacterized protein
MIDAAKVPADIRGTLNELERILAGYGSMMIAYSGGVDSGFLAYVAWHVLGERALPVLGISPSLGERQQSEAVAFLRRNGIPFERLETREMDDENYRRNNPDRCYFCKSELFVRLQRRAREKGFERIAYGANVDDRGDYRPGAAAAEELEVVAPLAQAGFSKEMIRSAARALELSLWDKPASPCLASRVPYFQEVTTEKLSQIEAAENILDDLGFKVRRVRHFGDTARVELPLGEHPRLRKDPAWAQVVAGFGALGFTKVVLDARGFESGRLNEALGDLAAGGEADDGAT